MQACLFANCYLTTYLQSVQEKSAKIGANQTSI